MYGGTCAPLHTLRSQRTTCRISRSPSTVKVPGAELKSSILVASPLNLSATLWTLAAVGLKEPEPSEWSREAQFKVRGWWWCGTQGQTQPHPAAARVPFRELNSGEAGFLTWSKKGSSGWASMKRHWVLFLRKHFTGDLWGVTRKKGVRRKKKTHKGARVWLLQRKTGLLTFITAAYEISVGAEVSASVGCLGM